MRGEALLSIAYSARHAHADDGVEGFSREVVDQFWRARVCEPYSHARWYFVFGSR